MKWQALAAKQVAQELHFSTIWSWGWTSYTGNKDPDFGKAACVWLWVRSSSLCNGPGGAGPGWNSSLTDGQLVFPAGTQCIVGNDRISQSSISQLEALTGDRQLAFTAVFARTIESRLAHVTQAQVLAAERGLIVEPLRRIALGLHGGARRGARLARRCAVDPRRRAAARSCSSGTSTSTRRRPRRSQNFYESYPDMLVRQVKSKPAAVVARRQDEGLRARGRRAGERLPARAAERAHAADGAKARSRCVRWARRSRSGRCRCRSSRRRSASRSSRSRAGDAFEEWTTKVQTAELANAICRGDDLPAPGPAQLSTFVPFLSVGAAALD